VVLLGMCAAFTFNSPISTSIRKGKSKHGRVWPEALRVADRWLAVILRLLLARVFVEGTYMREDLEGTV
jgi:hypothetical protein